MQSPHITLPLPDTWGNMPWGTDWEATTNRPPSPCIFDYGRGRDDPFMLDNPTTTQLYPYNCCDNLLCHNKQDLLGAQLIWMEPKFPTMAMVDAYRAKNKKAEI